MVDVGEKQPTVREALAECIVRMAPPTIEAVRGGTSKGDAIAVARVAGIMAAKKTSDLIPLCHPLPLTSVTIDFEFRATGVRVLARARVTGPTGVEMEALTAAAVAGLTLIDMTKGLERGVYLLVEQYNPAIGRGRVLEVDANGKVRWEVRGLDFPWDAQVLRNGNILVVEQQNRVSERDRTGKVVGMDRYYGSVFHAERLRVAREHADQEPQHPVDL